MSAKKIIIAGDTCIDYLSFTYAEACPRDKNSLTANWQNALNTKIFVQPGGVLLLNEFVKSATETDTISYQFPSIEVASSAQMIHSVSEVSKFPEKEQGVSFFRISRFLGYSGPDHLLALNIDHLSGDTANPDLVILDDVGNGFRNAPELWKGLLTKITKKTRILYKMSWPLFQGKLLEAITRSFASQVILVINADDLREDGLNISRNLSWEKTLLDFMLKTPAYEKFQSITTCADVIIRFGLEGALHIFNDRTSTKKAVLHYFPGQSEGSFMEKTPGKMQGLTSVFTASIAKEVLARGAESTISIHVEKAIAKALNSSLNLLTTGFSFKSGALTYPTASVFTNVNTDLVRKFALPLREVKSLQPDEWSILYEETQMISDLDIVTDYVVNGFSRSLQNVPIVRFGHLVLIDRHEIEKFRTVSNLMREYFRKGKSDQPLSIGVFGPPGSGKSFGVKQLVKDILGSKVSSIEFNLSEFQSREELIRAFHKVRDFTLKGEVPLIFFDEFDAAFHGASLGWLKYFLAPMQDGEFRDGDTVHPIGKAIFIFAGGTSSAFQEFSREKETDRQKILDFKTAKGPDFISRLKGYVNITGVNPTAISDHLFVIRRAIVLRVLLLKQKSIVDDHQRIHIDEDVLRALLLTPGYKHGARSMNAILEMSMLADRHVYEKAALPPKRQLDLHVDGDIFIKLVDKDLFYATTGKTLAKEIHDHYRANQVKKKNPKPASHPSMQPWERLEEELKNSNRHQAFDFFVKLLQVNCFYRRKDENDPLCETFEFSEKEVELLAEMEHKRWNADKIKLGWTYGEPRDDRSKIHDCLVTWRQLPPEVKGYDRDAVSAIPQIFRNAGLEVFRMDDLWALV